MNKLFLLIILILAITINAFAMRVHNPLILTYPITQDQISQLNKYLEDIWQLQQGRFEMDVVTTTKTNSNNGEFWVIQTGPNCRIQYKAGNHIYTITADGF